MSNPEFICQLLDRAKAITGSDYATAAKIGASRHALSDWRADRRPMPPADVALIADLAGLDAVAWTARDIAEQHAGTAKGEALQRVLKKSLVATGVAISTFGSANAEPLLHQLIRCINCSPLANVTTQRTFSPIAIN